MKNAHPYGRALFMVAQVHENWNLIFSELVRWKQLTKVVTVVV